MFDFEKIAKVDWLAFGNVCNEKGNCKSSNKSDRNKGKNFMMTKKTTFDRNLLAAFFSVTDFENVIEFLTERTGGNSAKLFNTTLSTPAELLHTCVLFLTGMITLTFSRSMLSIPGGIQ